MLVTADKKLASIGEGLAGRIQAELIGRGKETNEEVYSLTRVVISDCTDYNPEGMIQKLNAGIALLGGWERFVSPGMKVLLKVNLIGPKAPETAAITHPEFVRALVRILKGLGCQVWIGDSSGGAIAGVAPTARSFKVSGLEQMAREEGALIKNFDREGVVEVVPRSGLGGKMYIARPMFDADFVINLPKFKTHSAGVFTGAVKNLYGCIPGLRKAEYHRLAPDPRDFGAVLADIHQAVNVGLHIMDGVTAMQGEGPTAGTVYPAGKLLMSADPLALDTVAVAMLGLEIEDIPILHSARASGLGEASLQNIEIAGDYTVPPRLKGFKLPKRLRNIKPRTYRFVIKVIDFLKARPRVNLKACRHCNMCVESCPVQAIDRKTKAIDYGLCIECMCCHELCEHKAVELRRDNRFLDFLGRIRKRA
ncbi:MAG TPA: DUF362 domain-containing protein [Bacillota bacterium]|nr:DUF362 domain-containing protein [Bacillota bacterium]